ncbi:type II secretion system F family protein [Janibacter sp. UYMM211]|uniref:type II secretion system F family protein n=1 Tax=Janibacter sp. UYMM211 TaxID=3156342 RepID=UPI0033989341
MTTGDLPLMLLAGALVGLGLSMLLWRVRPAQVDLSSALDRLSPERSLAEEDRTQRAGTDADAKDTLGRWAMRTLPLDALGAVPTKELALLRIPVHRFFGEKVLFAVVGLVIPFALMILFSAVGLAVPVFFAIMGALLLGSLMFFLPDYNVRDDAAKARKEFGRALASYIDLVALERNAGSGPRQAMEIAAGIGDAWVFRRIGEELARSRWSGQPPWDALRKLSDDLGLPELADLADIMRLSGEEGAQVYTTLRARSQSMRTAELNSALAEANATGERLSIPMSTLGLIFMAILVTPALLRIVGS